MMTLNEAIKGDRRRCSPTEFLFRAVWLNIHYGANLLDPLCAFRACHFRAERRELLDLDDLDMTTESCTLKSQIGINAEHAAVVVAHQTEAIMFHHVRHTSSLDPLLNLLPGHGIVLKSASDLKEGNSRTAEDVGNFGHGTRLTISKPLACHFCAIAEAIEGLIINRWRG